MNSVLSLEIIGSEYLCWQEPFAKKILIENTCKPYSLKNVNTPKSVVFFVFHFVLEYRGYICHKADNYQRLWISLEITGENSIHSMHKYIYIYIYIYLRLKMKPSSVRIRYISWYFLFSLDDIRIHTFDTLLHQSLSLMTL